MYYRKEKNGNNLVSWRSHHQPDNLLRLFLFQFYFNRRIHIWVLWGFTGNASIRPELSLYVFFPLSFSFLWSIPSWALGERSVLCLLLWRWHGDSPLTLVFLKPQCGFPSQFPGFPESRIVPERAPESHPLSCLFCLYPLGFSQLSHCMRF